MREWLAASLLLLCLASGSAAAHEDESVDGWTREEMQVGHDHALTMSRLRQLARINRDLTELAQHDPTACRWMNQLTGPQTLAKQATAFDSNLRIRQIIEATMSVRSYLLTVYAVSETAIAVHAADRGIQLPAAASAGNIAFYRRYQVDIEQLLDAPDPC